MIFHLKAHRKNRNVIFQKRTLKCGATKKLTGADSAEYRKKEVERVKSYQQRKKREAEETDDLSESLKEWKRK